jgi:lysophospholipase L1-like esterase
VKVDTLSESSQCGCRKGWLHIGGMATGRLIRRYTYLTLVLAVCVMAAEGTARFDDWLHLDVPFLATPDSQNDLIIVDAHGRRGKPYGRFKKWKLNAVGFRGPEMSRDPAVDVLRIIVLGASEVFGLYESNQKEFPVQLADLLRQNGNGVEVINAAIAGMTVKSMLQYWKLWVVQFRPRIVVIYPSPQFYLVDNPEAAQQLTKSVNGSPPRNRVGSRFAERLRDIFDFPPIIQRWRTQRAIASKVDGKPADWFFQTVPEDRLRRFVADLIELTEAIQADGVEVVLMTHAIRTTSLSKAVDIEEVKSAREHVPRATPQTILAFEEAAAQAIRTLGRQLRIPIVDAASVMNGKRNWFGDLVHFNEAGAAVLARLVSQQIEQHLAMFRDPTRLGQ